MKKAIFLTLSLSLLLTTQVMASGSSGVPSGAPSGSSVDPLTVTETMKCKVTGVQPDGTILVVDEGKTLEHKLKHNFKTKVVAQDKKAFGGRKKIEIADLKEGHMLKVTVKPATGEVVRIKVLKAS